MSSAVTSKQLFIVSSPNICCVASSVRCSLAADADVPAGSYRGRWSSAVPGRAGNWEFGGEGNWGERLGGSRSLKRHRSPSRVILSAASDIPLAPRGSHAFWECRAAHPSFSSDCVPVSFFWNQRGWGAKQLCLTSLKNSHLVTCFIKMSVSS